MNLSASKIVKVQLQRHNYNIYIGTNLLSELGNFAQDCLPEKTKKIVIVSNPKVFKLYGEAAEKSLRQTGFDVPSWLMRDGERYKNWRSLEQALKFLAEKKITRTDAVIALGGGVVGDLAGFAAAVYQRGIPFLQVPTTFLAQIDSSVGGKTAVNTDFGKNLVGAFHQPGGVLIDVQTLKTLPPRELTAGFCEAVKHGAIGSRELFDQTHEFLQKFPLKNFRKFFAEGNSDFLTALSNLIAVQVSFKAEVVVQDETENVDREDSRSRKILNFGHTVGHALEKATDYRRFKHGEAVGLGMLAAAEISNKLGKLVKNELVLLYDVLHQVGRLPDAQNIEPKNLIAAFAHDKKTIGGSMRWILLEKIGLAAIISDKDIPEKTVLEAIRAALKK